MPYFPFKSAVLQISLASLVLSTACDVQAQTGSKKQAHIVALPSACVVAGDPLNLLLTGLPAGAVVTLQSKRVLTNDDNEPRAYQAQARFKADARGRVNLATQAPLDGSYRGADVRGLFWSMSRIDAADSAPPAPALTPLQTSTNTNINTEVTLNARIADKVVATRVINFIVGKPQLQTVNAEGFPGAILVSLPGSARRPAIILLGGSEGGSEFASVMAPKLASQGYAVLGLPYYSPAGYSANGAIPPELPSLPAAFADIPVDRLQLARDWLSQQPRVDASRIAVYGVSKGAEFALIASTHMPWIKAVVAVVPTDVVWEGWGPGAEKGDRPSFSWRGEPLPFVPYLDFAAEFDGYRTNTPVIVRRPQDRGRAANPDRVPAARIPVENYAGPMLLVAAGDDQLWDSGGMAKNIAQARTPKQVTQTLIYPTAGHLISGDGWRPTTGYNRSLSKVGGTPEGNAQAQADAWPKTLAFLKRHLGPVPR